MMHQEMMSDLGLWGGLLAGWRENLGGGIENKGGKSAL